VSLRYAYLGPVGTFTEVALRLVAGDDADGVALPSVDAALDAVRAGACDVAVVPIENSVEGGVTATLDALAAGEPLLVVGEVLVPVAFVLAARPGTALGDITRVGSHPHALAQCRGWLAAHLPGATTVPALSTSAAAQGLAAGVAGYDAVLCADAAARAFGLAVLAEGVADRATAVTRFVLVARPGSPGAVPAPTGADKTTVVAYLRRDHAGALLELLEQFATRGVNLSRIESRPVGTELGLYCFSIDCEGHVADPRVGEALTGLRRVTADLRFLGSYPRADGVRPQVAPGTADRDFTEAREWLARVAGGRPG
jgi:prephenate dehydratase